MGQIRHCSRVHQLRSVQGKGQWLWMPDAAQLLLHVGVHASHSLLLSGAHSSTSPPPHRRTPSASTPSSTRTTVNTLAQAAVEPPPVDAPTAEDPQAAVESPPLVQPTAGDPTPTSPIQVLTYHSGPATSSVPGIPTPEVPPPTPALDKQPRPSCHRHPPKHYEPETGKWIER